MALEKDFQTSFGVTANYHKISKIEIDSKSSNILITVAVYLNEAARLSGEPIWHEYVSIPFSALNFDPRDQFYPLLKEYSASYLKDAVDKIPEGHTPVPSIFDIVN